MSEVSLRSLSPVDWDLWRSLRIEATAGDPDAFGSTMAEVLATTPAQWQTRLAAAPSLHLVATIDEIPVGMVAVSGLFELGSLWIRGSGRGTGAGRALLQAAMDWAGSAGAASVHLAVRESNTAAVALYRSLGFIEVGEDYLNPERVHRLLLMARTLDRAGRGLRAGSFAGQRHARSR